MLLTPALSSRSQQIPVDHFRTIAIIRYPSPTSFASKGPFGSLVSTMMQFMLGMSRLVGMRNGVKETTHEGVSIARLMAISNENDKGLIVELNGRFVHAREYSKTFLGEVDRVEFINAACGG